MSEDTMDKIGRVKQLLKELFPYGHPRFIDLTIDEIRLHSEKNHDYARNGDPLGNFKRVSNLFDQWGASVSPWIVAWTYMMKQVDALGNMFMKKYEGQVEGVAGRTQDISVYAKLARILYEEQKMPNVGTASKPVNESLIDYCRKQSKI